MLTQNFGLEIAMSSVIRVVLQPVNSTRIINVRYARIIVFLLPNALSEGFGALATNILNSVVGRVISSPI